MMSVLGQASVRRVLALLAGVAMLGSAVGTGVVIGATPAVADTLSGPLHTSGNDGYIYDSSNRPVRLVGFNWTGTELGGRTDDEKAADECGSTWRTPADSLSGLSINYDDSYQVIKDLGYNVLRVPVSWNNLEPVAPEWDGARGSYVHAWNENYLADLRSMVNKASAAGLMVILDMHQDYWSPALHHITNWDGSAGYCEGSGMPRWLYPTADGKATTTQNVDFRDSMNWFFRNQHDPLSTTTRATPWQLFSAAWDELAMEFSAEAFPGASAVIGADLMNEPYWSYVGYDPPAGQSVLQAAGTRLQAFYEAVAPAVTDRDPSWLLFFQDCTGGYNSANPAVRETPTMSGRPNVPGNWVYSYHAYDFSYGTFSDGVVRHDDFGITLANAMLARAEAWKVPLYVGEFTNFTRGVDARQLTSEDMAQTREFLSWAKQNHVSWTFWAFVNPWWPMAFLNYRTGEPIPVVRDELATGIDDTSPPVSPPSVPREVTASGGDQSAVVSFSPPASTGGSPVTSYTVTSDPGGVVASGGSSPITVTGLRNGTTYTFTVTATNVAGASSPSAASNPVTPAAPATSSELLADPGFELGNGGWVPFIVGDLARVGSPVHGGSSALRVAATSNKVNYVGLTQNSVVTASVAGTTYTASCWVRPTQGSLSVRFRFLEYTQNWASYVQLASSAVNDVPAGSWTLVQVSGTAVRSGERVIPQIYTVNQTTGTGAMLYDDCSVRAGDP